MQICPTVFLYETNEIPMLSTVQLLLLPCLSFCTTRKMAATFSFQCDGMYFTCFFFCLFVFFFSFGHFSFPAFFLLFSFFSFFSPFSLLLTIYFIFLSIRLIFFTVCSQFTTSQFFSVLLTVATFAVWLHFFYLVRFKSNVFVPRFLIRNSGCVRE